MKKEFVRHTNSLNSVFDFTHLFIQEFQLGHDLETQINLVIEEVFTNMVKYSADNPNKIRLELKKDNDQLNIILTDYDVEQFDIRDSIEYNIHQPLEDRPVGKIGLHLVKKYVDEIKYEYKNTNSKITLIKFTGNSNA